MSRVAELLAESLSGPETKCLSRVAVDPAFLSDANLRTLVELRLIEPCEADPGYQLTELGEQVLDVAPLPTGKS